MAAASLATFDGDQNVGVELDDEEGDAVHLVALMDKPLPDGQRSLLCRCGVVGGAGARQRRAHIAWRGQSPSLSFF